MTDEEEKIKELLEQILKGQNQYSSWQRKTATAVTNLSLGLNNAEISRRNDHQALSGLVLACLPDAPKKKSERKRRDSDDTDTFKLLGGNQLQLTRTTQKRIVTAVLAVLAFVATHVAAYFMLPHPQTPAMAAPRAPDVVSSPTPRLAVPVLAPPKVP